MSQPIDTAYVEVKPDLDRFGADLARRLSASLSRAQANVDRSMRETSDRVGAAGQRAGQQFGEGFTRDANGKLRDARGRFVAEGRAAGDAFGRGFQANAKKAIDRLKSAITGAVAGLSGLGRSAVRVTALAGAVGAAATAVAGLASAAAGALPVIASLAAALGTAAGTLVAIPGAIAVVQAGLGTLRIGLSGVGDAMKAVAEGNADKLNEALKGLAPAAQQFVRQVNALKPAFDRLRLDVQNELFADTANTLKTLATSLLPTVQVGMVGVADAINQQVIGALRGLNTAVNRVNIAQVFASVRDIIGDLGPALQPVTQALLDIVGVTSVLLADLTNEIGVNMGAFAERVSELARTGGLAQIFRDGLDVAGQLFAALRDVGGIISGIFSAAGTAAGGGLLDFLDRLNETVNSLAGQQALQNLFAELARIGESLQPVLLAVAEGLGPVARGIADIAVAFGPVLVSLAERLGPGLASLAPAVISLAPAVQALGGALQPLADIISTLVTNAAPGLTRFLEGLAAGLEALAPAAAPVGQALGTLMQALAPLLPLIGAQLANVLTIAANALSTIAVEFGPLIGLIADTGAEMARTFLPVLVELGRVGIPLAAQVGTILLEAFKPLAPVLLQLAQVIAAQLLAYLPQIQQMMTQLLPVIAQVAGAFGQALLIALQEIVPVLPQLIQAGLQFALALTQMVVALAPLLPDLTQLIGLVTSFLVNPNGLRVLTVVIKSATTGIQVMTAVIGAASAAFSAVSGAVGRFAGAVRDGVSRAVQVAKELPGKVRDAVGNLGRLLYNAGAQVINGLIDGIKSKLGALGSFLGGVGDFIADHKGPLDRDRRLLVPAADAMMDGLIATLAERQRGDLAAQLAGMSGQIGDVRAASTQLAALTAPSPAVATSSASAAGSVPPTIVQAPTVPAPTVQVFIDGQELRAITSRVVDERVARNNTALARGLNYRPRTV